MWLLRLSAWYLIGAGIVVSALGVSGRFLPHDEAYLGMTARDLCALHACKIVHFMIHDRISFGGALIAVGLLYRWLTNGPIAQRQAWAWRLLARSAGIGFASFFAYLGYGYLDTWHGLATLALLPCFAIGLLRTRPVNQRMTPIQPLSLGRVTLLATSAGIALGGFTIMLVGTTCVFVPQDLAFMGVDVAELHALNPRLVPLIAHDRAGFGGAVCCVGVALFFTIRYATWSCDLWRTLLLIGIAGFGAGIGAHPAVGYVDALHLAPALVGGLTYASGLALSYPSKTLSPKRGLPSLALRAQ